MATTSDKIKTIRYLLSLSLSGFLAILVIFCGWQIVKSVSQKYQTRYFEKELAQLKAKNQQLKIDVAKLQSIDRIKELALNFQMSPASTIVYLPVISSEMAIKK